MRPNRTPYHTSRAISFPSLQIRDWTPTHLANKLLVRGWIISTPERLLHESQKDRHNDGGLDGLTHGDKEHCKVTVSVRFPIIGCIIRSPGTEKTLGILIEGRPKDQMDSQSAQGELVIVLCKMFYCARCHRGGFRSRQIIRSDKAGRFI